VESKISGLPKFDGGPFKFLARLRDKNPINNAKINLEYKKLQEESLFIDTSALTRSPIHGDGGFSNFLVENGNVSGVIDFGAVRWDYLICDPAFFLARTQICKTRDSKKFATFITAYIKASGIDKQQLYNIGYFVKAVMLIDLFFGWHFYNQNIKNNKRNRFFEKFNERKERISKVDVKMYNKVLGQLPATNLHNHVFVGGPPGSGKTTLARYFKKHGKNGIYEGGSRRE
jgi:Ser/Thr protein kinase RdoA (MazF antagonist)